VVGSVAFVIDLGMLLLLAPMLPLILETVNRRAGEIYVLVADHLITRSAHGTAPADPDAPRDRAPRDRAS
jgi:hypothetical protein